MQIEFQYNMQLKQLDSQGSSAKDIDKENRKDERTRIQATQQSELIDQRNNQKPPKKFEKTGNDTIGGFGM